ncbi:hypothetical protein M9458_055811, partial [Cirrhinus mrigala]
TDPNSSLYSVISISIPSSASSSNIALNPRLKTTCFTAGKSNAHWLSRTFVTDYDIPCF